MFQPLYRRANIHIHADDHYDFAHDHHLGHTTGHYPSQRSFKQPHLNTEYGCPMATRDKMGREESLATSFSNPKHKNRVSHDQNHGRYSSVNKVGVQPKPPWPTSVGYTIVLLVFIKGVLFKSRERTFTQVGITETEMMQLIVMAWCSYCVRLGTGKLWKSLQYVRPISNNGDWYPEGDDEVLD